MNESILNGLFDQQWYNGENIKDNQTGYVLFENKILGSPRLRQLRVSICFYLLKMMSSS
jgi:hypothetical protein